MKRFLLFALCFLLFIVAYGCAQGDDISAPQSSVGQSEQSLSSSGGETLSGEPDTTTESGDASGESDSVVSDDSSIHDTSIDESSEHNENSGSASAESSDDSSSNSEPSDDSSVPDESAPDTSTPDESSDT